MEKHKFASIALTMRDRVILWNFSTHRVSAKCTIGNFQKIFLSPKIEFSYFYQKTEKYKFASISLTVRDRAISSKFSTHRVSEQCTLGNFQKKISSSHIWRPFYIFEFLSKMEKHKFAYLLNCAR